MGNSHDGSAIDMFKDFEFTTGKLLLRAIGANSVDQVKQAIEFAQKELIRPNIKKSAEDDWEEMAEKIKLYLTRQYDVGDGMFGKKTPVDYAKKIGSNDVVPLLEDSIRRIGNTDASKEINIDQAPRTVAAIGGKLDPGRVALAKERLAAFQRTKNP
ncbi:hypothetical protein B484DRAFT_159030 [Ochromonadaceae sp. CCMP2298]|nr:hypothetical protein B484DRAFT_159030 [Ochromonadaceae sp. CCMP2298]